MNFGQPVEKGASQTPLHFTEQTAISDAVIAYGDPYYELGRTGIYIRATVRDLIDDGYAPIEGDGEEYIEQLNS